MTELTDDTSAEPAKKFPARLRDVRFGAGVTVVEPCNLYGCEIGANSFVGPFTEIQADAFVGSNSRIQSHTFICSKVHIGDSCFIGHGVMFINDRLRGGTITFDKEGWEETHIGNNVVIGSNATILPVRICDNAVIGAGAVVTRDITTPGTFVGNPARLIRPDAKTRVEKKPKDSQSSTTASPNFNSNLNISDLLLNSEDRSLNNVADLARMFRKLEEQQQHLSAQMAHLQSMARAESIPSGETNAAAPTDAAPSAQAEHDGYTAAEQPPVAPVPG